MVEVRNRLGQIELEQGNCSGCNGAGAVSWHRLEEMAKAWLKELCELKKEDKNE
jgi:hypothetical protein